MSINRFRDPQTSVWFRLAQGLFDYIDEVEKIWQSVSAYRNTKGNKPMPFKVSHYDNQGFSHGKDRQL